MLSQKGLALLNRRTFLGNIAAAGGSFALAHLLARDGLLAASTGPYRPAIDSTHPTTARPPQYPAAADQLLIIFCAGAVSQVDSFDYKPELFRHDGADPPADAPKVTFQGPIGKLAKPFWDFKPRGQCGKMISELFPHVAELADEICFIHSLVARNSAGL